MLPLVLLLASAPDGGVVDLPAAPAVVAWDASVSLAPSSLQLRALAEAPVWAEVNGPLEPTHVVNAVSTKWSEVRACAAEGDVIAVRLTLVPAGVDGDLVVDGEGEGDGGVGRSCVRRILQRVDWVLPREGRAEVQLWFWTSTPTAPNAFVSDVDVTAALQTLTPALTACHQALLDEVPDAEGDLRLWFSWDTAGKVVDVRALPSSLDDVGTQVCAELAVERMRLPRLRGGRLQGATATWRCTRQRRPTPVSTWAATHHTTAAPQTLLERLQMSRASPAPDASVDGGADNAFVVDTDRLQACAADVTRAGKIVLQWAADAPGAASRLPATTLWDDALFACVRGLLPAVDVGATADGAATDAGVSVRRMRSTFEFAAAPAPTADDVAE